MKGSAFATSLIVLLALLAACSPSAPQAPSQAPAQSSAQTSAPTVPSTPKRLTIALEGEPGNLIGGMEGGGVSPGSFNDAFQHRLASYNDRGDPVPQLAAELPAQDKGTWIVQPDGSMQTTYRLRPDVTWHDGTLVTARDFAFAWTVHMDPALPISGRRIGALIERIDTPDERTLVINWKATYPFANVINQEELGPIPAHILQGPYESDKARLESHPYWKREFVGTGPYRLAQWEPGSHIVAEAYDRFYAGRAKIDTIVFRFVPDGSTALANFMAGSVDGSLEAIDLNQVVFAGEEMRRTGRQPTQVLVPTHWRMLSMQFKPEVVRPQELLDIRARRGLLHAIDRKALADTVMSGTSMASETFITPTDPRWDWIKDVIVPYAYDTRQAQQLMEQVGWRRAGDGRMLDANGQQVTIALWTTGGEQNETETNIVADYWRQAGLAVEQTTISNAQQRDRRLRASYPGFDTTSVPLRFDNTVSRVYGLECPTAENDWVGSNRGCYRNPAMDRAVDALRAAIDPGDQRRLYREMVQLHMQELPVLSTYFNIHADIFRDGITGIRASSYLVRVPWNIGEWDIR